MSIIKRAQEIIDNCEVGPGCGVCPVIKELLDDRQKLVDGIFSTPIEGMTETEVRRIAGMQRDLRTIDQKDAIDARAALAMVTFTEKEVFEAGWNAFLWGAVGENASSPREEIETAYALYLQNKK